MYPSTPTLVFDWPSAVCWLQKFEPWSSCVEHWTEWSPRRRPLDSTSRVEYVNIEFMPSFEIHRPAGE